MSNQQKMQAALEQIVDHTFHDAVNGRDGDELTITRAQINEIYELARIALLA